MLADHGVRVPQAQGDVGDVSVHQRGVEHAQVAQRRHHVDAHGHLLRHLQLLHQDWDGLPRQLLVLQAQLTWGAPPERQSWE